ncbi:YdeI family protein [Acaryochloris sp. CCMEE 5410]|uniref:YdeI/OmpD-associated family protein n=1 Tax=Acaryochloris sp. CCMEE 5410 TaxID=310037 RepID=UPI00024846AB|nr:YdeI/OmpD-associated family protein [Acaryochloris sp. CCMEE 5410]KAI9134973.1 YdeI/OmpD-associated family protein [Acaryochloris sp. CCMEE 5410]
MQVTVTFKATSRKEWRDWLTQHHQSASEIWLLSDDRPGVPTVSYLDSVEEAICFGWIDGIAKRISSVEKAQRFTPRRPRSHWTELNKERTRRLIKLGLMTSAGQKKLPDLSLPFDIADDIITAIQAEPKAWTHFKTFPDLYIRVRIGYIEEMRKRPEDFDKRLKNFISKTAAGKRFGQWNDGGRLG